MTTKVTLLVKNRITSKITLIIGLSNSIGYSSAMALNSRQGRKLGFVESLWVIVTEEENMTAAVRPNHSNREYLLWKPFLQIKLQIIQESQECLTVQRMGRKGKYQERDQLASSKLKSIGHLFWCRIKQTEERLFWLWFLPVKCSCLRVG